MIGEWGCEGEIQTGEVVASKAGLGEHGLDEAAQVPDQALASTPSKASGLTKYRAPTGPLQRSKLESFDRKIGRATNSLQVLPFGRSVCICGVRLQCVWSPQESLSP